VGRANRPYVQHGPRLPPAGGQPPNSKISPNAPNCRASRSRRRADRRTISSCGDEQSHEQKPERQQRLRNDKRNVGHRAAHRRVRQARHDGQANTASMRQVAIVTRSEKISNALRARAAASARRHPCGCGARGSRPGPAARNTEPIMRNSNRLLAQEIDTARNSGR